MVKCYFICRCYKCLCDWCSWRMPNSLKIRPLKSQRTKRRQRERKLWECSQYYRVKLLNYSKTTMLEKTSSLLGSLSSDAVFGLSIVLGLVLFFTMSKSKRTLTDSKGEQHSVEIHEVSSYCFRSTRLGGALCCVNWELRGARDGRTRGFLVLLVSRPNLDGVPWNNFDETNHTLLCRVVLAEVLSQTTLFITFTPTSLQYMKLSWEASKYQVSISSDATRKNDEQVWHSLRLHVSCGLWDSHS